MKKDPRTATSGRSLLEPHREEIVRCVKCGSCRAVCPSFLHTQAESFSARGRIALVKAVLDGRLAASEIYRDRLATCTSCLACEAACASSVPVTAIIQAAKEAAVEEAGTGLISSIVAGVLKNDVLLRAAAWLAPFALHYAAGSVKGGPAERSGFAEKPAPPRKEARSARSRERVVFFPGCAVTHFQHDIAAAVVKVLTALGCDVVIPEGLKCCGRPLLSLGDRRAAEELALHNSRLLSGLDVDAVITACASCGLTFKKDYPKLLPPGTKKPEVLDIHEFLRGRLSTLRFASVERRITVHDPCHLGRGQGLSQTVRDVLAAVPGLKVVEMQNADRCCGFGGVMRVTHRSLSAGIAEEKAKTIIATGAGEVAAACPGCRMQIADALRNAGSEAVVVHPVQILAEALASRAECEVSSAEWETVMQKK